MSGQEGAELFEPGLDVGLGQKLLLLLDRERQARTEEVGQSAGLPRVHRGDLQFLGDLLALVDHPLKEKIDVVDQGVKLDPFLDHVVEGLDPTDQERLGLDDLDQPGADHPLADDPGRTVGELEHLEDGADADRGVEVADGGVVGLGMALGDEAEGFFAGHDVVDQLDPGGPIDHQRDDGLRKDDVGSERQQGDAVGSLARLGPLGQDEQPPSRSFFFDATASVRVTQGDVGGLGLGSGS